MLMNLVIVFPHLCSKVQQNKVDPAYLPMDTCRVNTTDESRRNATSNEVFCEQQETGKEQNFPLSVGS